MSLAGKKILLGITGSIAAYKSILLTRLLVKQGAEVRIIMTPAAGDFVSPLVLSTLSKNEVLHHMASQDAWANHVMLGRWADLLVIAPASCNTLAKMSAGICDNLLMAVYLSATCPVWVAPAMDEDMWKHPATRQNLARIASYGHRVLQVGLGELASGLVGEGRMAEPEELLAEMSGYFQPKAGPLQGMRALVTAGPTYEPIDPVRFIGNHSSGLMGIEVANALQEAGAKVHLVLGPTHLQPAAGISVTRVTTAQQMFDAAIAEFPASQVAVMAAAVADYRPLNPATEKIKKSEAALNISLTPNPDILRYCGHHKQSGQFVAGFALETAQEEANAVQKLENKHADMIVLNSLRDPEAGFGKATNKISIFEKDGSIHRFAAMSKAEAARKIVETIATRYQHDHDL